VTRQKGQTASVHFNIERVTLHGFSPSQRARFVSSLETSLAALAANNTVDWRQAPTTRLARIDAGELRFGTTPEEAARALVARLATAVSGRAETSRRGEHR
jgi:plasmid stabilization system protein ParE